MGNVANFSTHLLFGGELGWDSTDWVSSDDRVRGGCSESHLCLEKGHAIFCGNLDIDTLGGAGFASQRTTGDDRCWDLSRYEGIEITCDASNSDDKIYTFILKDHLLPPSDNGREQSTVSWEYDFSKKDAMPRHNHTGLATIRIPWQSFKPTYRGRPKDDTKPLAKDGIKRMSIMMRSFFGTQHGNFGLDLIAISGATWTQNVETCATSEQDVEEQSSTNSLNKAADPSVGPKKKFWAYLLCWKL